MSLNFYINISVGIVVTTLIVTNPLIVTTGPFIQAGEWITFYISYIVSQVNLMKIKTPLKCSSQWFLNVGWKIIECFLKQKFVPF